MRVGSGAGSIGFMIGQDPSCSTRHLEPHGPSAMKSTILDLNPVRGLLAAVVGASAGAVAPIAIMVACVVLRWWITGASDFDRRYDIGWIRENLPGPVIGCAMVCACAAWATFAPRGSFRFARTLAIVTAISFCLWFVVGSMELTPRRLKGIEHPMFYPSELLLLMGPPIVAAALVTAIRVRGTPQQIVQSGAATSIAGAPARTAD